MEEAMAIPVPRPDDDCVSLRITRGKLFNLEFRIKYLKSSKVTHIHIVAHLHSISHLPYTFSNTVRYDCIAARNDTPPLRHTT